MIKMMIMLTLTGQALADSRAWYTIYVGTLLRSPA